MEIQNVFPPPRSAGTSAASAGPRLPRRRAVRGVGLLGSLALLLRPAVGQNSEAFTVLSFREPGQCERMQCLSGRAEFCREHSEGYYLKEQGCKDGKICTNCEYGNSSVPTRCRCENPPYAVQVQYNQECNTGKVCAPGQGICYRPCGTYLHVSQCPSSYCMWNKTKMACVKRPPAVASVVWADIQDVNSPYKQGQAAVARTAASEFPLSFADFEVAAEGYRVRGMLLKDIAPLESIYLQLDSDFDGEVSASEFAALPDVLLALDSAAAELRAKAAAGAATAAAANTSGSATSGASARQLQVVTPEICNQRRPRQFYCSFDASCKADCRECGWKSATDVAFSTCVQPSPEACYADGRKVYCPADQLCKPPGDCSSCVDRPIVDHEQHMCLALWWDPEPLTQWTSWVCRHRNKVGMPCASDQDCIYGLRRCLQGQCQPFQPYNANQTCVSDLDCPHLGYYCPADPTGGENPYWVQYCRRQRDEGARCSEDRECGPQQRCNDGEPLPRCRRLFSLPIGVPSKDDNLCSSGWRDGNGECAPSAKSKEAGRSCDTDRDCVTTDRTGRTGQCVCKAWWDKKDPKYCLPVAGDYSKHQERLRNYLWFRATNCGSFWTEEECLSIFGDQALRLRLEVECEAQQLSGGPYLPPAECGIIDETRFPDACRRLQSLR